MQKYLKLRYFSCAKFLGKQYFICHGQNKATEVRKLTDLGLNSTVEKLDAAFVWGHNGKTYLFSGTSYWR